VDLLESDGADLLFGDWAIQKHAGGSYAESDSHAGRVQVFHFHLSSICGLHSSFSSAVGRGQSAICQALALAAVMAITKWSISGSEKSVSTGRLFLHCRDRRVRQADAAAVAGAFGAGTAD
jgi:hypothetical protein